MNERTEMLAKEAAEYAIEFATQDQELYMPKLMEKFAELIVKECADVLVTEMNRLDELNRVVAAQTLDTAQVLIKQHFGVE